MKGLAIPILADDSLLTGRFFEVPANPPSFTLGAEGNFGGYPIKYSFWNTGITTVYLDSLKCYDEAGKEFVQDTTLMRYYHNLVTAPTWNQIDYWWLRDEPKYDYYQPWAKVRTLVNTAAGTDKSIGAFWPTTIQNGWSTEEIAATVRSFLEATHQNRIIINDYPFIGGLDIGTNYLWFTTYTGYEEQDESQSAFRGIQREIEDVSAKILGVLAEEVRDGGILKEFWQSPQWMYSGAAYTGGEPPNTKYIYRPLTRSELRLQIGLGLCYGAKGFNFWRYDYGLCDPGRCDIGSDNSCWQGGLYDTVGGIPQRNSLMWDVLANEINPYLKAIDTVYLGLHWNRAYACSSGVPINTPGGTIISSISAFSNSPDSNPDLGWFHVGEFDSSGERYVMIVNRACSQGQYDPTEAPSITATIQLDADNLALNSNSLYVIDLAHSFRYAGLDTGWVGIPETTYTTGSYLIPFTTTLKAGEGKLFKIAKSF